jgi:hypothetical protein
VQRTRGNSQNLPKDDCGNAGGSWQFSRVNCRGKSKTRASADRLPGHCGLLNSLLLERVGSLATARSRKSDSSNRASVASAGKSGAPCECFRTSAIVPPLLAVGREDKRSTNDAAGWLVRPHLFFWCSRHRFAGSRRITQVNLPLKAPSRTSTLNA